MADSLRSLDVLDELAPAFERLDLLIAAATGTPPADGLPAVDPYRGLYVAPEDVPHLLRRAAGAPGFDTDLPAMLPALDSPRLARLQDVFELTVFDLDLLLVALAPELDLRYERLYAFLQDDVTRRKPTLDLALNLLCRAGPEKLARRSHVDAGSPLLRHGLLRLVADPHHAPSPLLAHYLQPDAQVLRWVFRQDGLDPRLEAFCSLEPPASSPAGLDLERVEQIARRIREARRGGTSLHLAFHGAAGVGKRETAHHAALMAGAPFLSADLAAALDGASDAASTLAVLLRERRWRGAVLYLEGLDALRETGRSLTRRDFLARLAAEGGVVIAADTSTAKAEALDAAVDWLPIAFALPQFHERRVGWQSALEDEKAALDDEALDRLAGSFRLTPRRMRDAARRARLRREFAGDGTLGVDHVMAAVREQSGQALAGIARKVDITQGWGDLMVPAEALSHLHELCAQVRYHHVVHDDWGFGRKIGRGRGISALFSGGSGTGKTMAAGIIANELGLDLYRIDLSQVVNKYIGETEKNLDRVFNAAEQANAILFFDEADSLFGKRSEVKDAHDRYANLEVSYLLQKMEEYEGLAILASNLRQNLDEAFLRRLSFIIEFPFPDEAQRRQIWSVLFPHEAPLANDIDYELLAREVRLSGGHLRNIALTAAYLAARDGGMIHQRHLLQAARREHQKLGRTWEPSRRPSSGESS